MVCSHWGGSGPARVAGGWGPHRSQRCCSCRWRRCTPACCCLMAAPRARQLPLPKALLPRLGSGLPALDAPCHEAPPHSGVAAGSATPCSSRGFDPNAGFSHVRLVHGACGIVGRPRRWGHVGHRCCTACPPDAFAQRRGDERLQQRHWPAARRSGSGAARPPSCVCGKQREGAADVHGGMARTPWHARARLRSSL